MDFDSSNNGDARPFAKAKNKTFKEFQLERLIKEGRVIPASMLAEAKSMELQRIRDHEAAIEDEIRHRRTAAPAPKNKLANLPLTRERFESDD